MTGTLNVLHPDDWTHRAAQILDSYTQDVYDAKTELDRRLNEKQWNFGEALLFSITVITTIGQCYAVRIASAFCGFF